MIRIKGPSDYHNVDLQVPIHLLLSLHTPHLPLVDSLHPVYRRHIFIINSEAFAQAAPMSMVALFWVKVVL